jgi:hypothetical protein
VRELEGALISLLAQSSLNKKEIDVELAKKVLRNFVKTSSKEITIDAIQKMVCEYFDVSYDKLLHKTRKREIVQARQITMYLAKAFTKNSLKNIGEHFGGRDHGYPFLSNCKGFDGYRFFFPGKCNGINTKSSVGCHVRCLGSSSQSLTVIFGKSLKENYFCNPTRER